LTSPIVVVDGGIHGNSPSGVGGSGIIDGVHPIGCIIVNGIHFIGRVVVDGGIDGNSPGGIGGSSVVDSVKLLCVCALLILLIIHLINIDDVFTLVLLFLVPPMKNILLSPTKSVSPATSTGSIWTKLSASSSTSSLNTSARKLILESPIKLPACHIEWFNYKAIRFEVKKYLKKENKTPTIEKDISYLLSKFSMIKICNALLITVGKLNVDSLTGIDELPQRKPKLIDFFSKLIYNHMTIFDVSLKRDEWYVLRLNETIYSKPE
jgi:hypothetical protein